MSRPGLTGCVLRHGFDVMTWSWAIGNFLCHDPFLVSQHRRGSRLANVIATSFCGSDTVLMRDTIGRNWCHDMALVSRRGLGCLGLPNVDTEMGVWAPSAQ